MIRSRMVIRISTLVTTQLRMRLRRLAKIGSASYHAPPMTSTFTCRWLERDEESNEVKRQAGVEWRKLQSVVGKETQNDVFDSEMNGWILRRRDGERVYRANRRTSIEIGEETTDDFRLGSEPRTLEG
ncbi:hypothetical protein K458DRAFT_43383 [Lentithecium fluviatile CBS 122367]|uniref:Uncharacterized protein n=1 Tax=Lentithecium fluviatile CBS 122367 TaxID=1168545 RepID=A0A6G1J0Z9_9PLEO|nr:hypothetical protein K458DRAFT_43383 [Lentithecium fluviatile CBS 122367]